MGRTARRHLQKRRRPPPACASPMATRSRRGCRWCASPACRARRDFHDLATHLSRHRERPRRVVAFDYRGRGRSAWRANIADYNPLTEMSDVLRRDGGARHRRAVVVGTSRGGIIAMLMAVARPATLAGVVLNDIGPAIEPRGLARIKTYVGRTPSPDDWSDAAAHPCSACTAPSSPASARPTGRRSRG